MARHGRSFPSQYQATGQHQAPGPQAHYLTLTAGLSFAGSVSRSVAKVLAASTLSHTGLVFKEMTKLLAAGQGSPNTLPTVTSGTLLSWYKADAMSATYTNQCLNPSFEHDTPGSAPAAWNTGGSWLNAGATLSVTSTGAHSGSNCMQVVTSGSTAFTGASIAGPAMVVGQSYRVRLWLKGAAGGEVVQLGVGYGGNGDHTTTNLTLTSSWQEYSLSWTATGTDQCQIALRSTAATAMTFYVDDVVLTQGPLPPHYFDGDTAGASWSGTAGNSTSTGTVAPNDGDSLPSWPDASGNGYAAVQNAISAWPTYHIAQQNGLPAVTFNGSPDQLLATIPSTSQPVTIFVLFKGPVSFAQGLWGGTSGSLRAYVTGGSGYFLVGTSSISGGTVTSGSWFYSTAVANNTSSLVRLNGSQVASGAIGTSALGTSFSFGADNASDYFTGPIGEVLVYTGALTSTDYVAIESYLYNKWLAAQAWGFSGVVSSSRIKSLILTAAMSFTGASTKTSLRALTAAATFAGLTTRSIGRMLPSVLSSTGGLNRATGRLLNATTGSGGNVLKLLVMVQTAGASPSGTLSREPNKSLAASLGESGTLQRTASRSFPATMALVGVITRAGTRLLGGSGAYSGSLAVSRFYSRLLSGGLSFIGTTSNRAITRVLSASVTPTSRFVRALTRSLTGSGSPSGTLARGDQRTLPAGSTFTGGLAKAAKHLTTGNASYTGRASKTTVRTVQANQSFSGNNARNVTRSFIGDLATSGQITRAGKKLLTAVLTPAVFFNTRWIHVRTGAPPLRDPTLVALGLYSTAARLGVRLGSAAIFSRQTSTDVTVRTTRANPSSHASSARTGIRATTQRIGRLATAAPTFIRTTAASIFKRTTNVQENIEE